MKNSLNFILSRSFNFCFDLNPKVYVFLFFVSLLCLSNVANAQVTIINDNFETGFGNWNDGGSNCIRSNNNFLSGNYNIRIRNGSGSSNTTTDGIDLTPYGQVQLLLSFYLQGYENGDDFFIEYSSNGAFNDTNVLRNYIRGSGGINNNQRYNIVITLSRGNFNFATNSRFRIRGSANNNNDRLYVDNLRVRGYLPPANDDCANAISLTPSEFCAPTLGSTTYATQSIAGCAGTSDDDVWYSFTAASTQNEIIVNPTTLNDAVIQVFDACGGTSLGCEDSTGGSSSESLLLSGLTIGDVYYVRVYSYFSNSNQQGEFEICIVEQCSPSTDLGTSTVGCPFINVGGVGLGTTAPPPVDCAVGEVTIEATYLELGDTSSYSVEPIAYNPPFQFGCLANPVSVNLDDIWSPVVNLPFDFCFYDNTYNSVVIGSNGVISFDTSLANGPMGYHNVNNIPTTFNAFGGGAFSFGPSIYGVHHDVDPSIGGEIGYQLITLDSGCQALVAAWADVPMFLDNSILYSGMMVFYENTNIIEVYVKEKNIDGSHSGYGGPWNFGNAAIGLQANPSEGISAPGRNTNDPNWTATEEAWRFVPNGTSITELKWYEGSVSAANEIIDPDNNGQISVSPSSPTTYIAEVTYTLCDGSTVVESSSTTAEIIGNKTWNGSVSTAWENANNWTPVGVPVPADCITIPNTANDPIMLGSTNGFGYNLVIEDGATFTQQPSSSLTIEDFVRIEPNGSFYVENDACLIQINDVTTNNNLGEANIQRHVTSVNNFDYVYWSSPVEGFDVENISPGTPSYAIFDWTPTVANGTIGQHGTWNNTTEDMIPGKGYIVRGLIGNSIANTAEFTGVLNNGQISYPISRGTWTGADYPGIGNMATAEDDNWNLIGNPYPSSISLNDFVSANPAIDGTLYFWRHLNAANSAIDNPFFEDYVYSYNENDYIAANSMGSSPPGFNDYIASGQGFFAFMLDSAPSPNTVNFSNTMRGLYANNGFYRNAANTEDKHRIWLDLIDENNTWFI